MDATAARQALQDMHRDHDVFGPAECDRANHLIDIINEAHMAARIGKAKITTKDGRTKIEPAKAYRNVSQRIGGKAKADRKEAGYRRNAARAKG